MFSRYGTLVLRRRRASRPSPGRPASPSSGAWPSRICRAYSMPNTASWSACWSAVARIVAVADHLLHGRDVVEADDEHLPRACRRPSRRPRRPAPCCRCAQQHGLEVGMLAEHGRGDLVGLAPSPTGRSASRRSSCPAAFIGVLEAEPALLAVEGGRDALEDRHRVARLELRRPGTRRPCGALAVVGADERDLDAGVVRARRRRACCRC